MPTFSINNWKGGIDTRRSQLTSSANVLLQLDNAHVNQGGEIEKRKAFVRQIQPTGTFGAQPTPTTIYVFGSTTDPGVQPPFTYQQLTVPNGSSMTGVVCSTLFANQPFVVATFSDLKTYAFYNGTYVADFIAGQVNIFPSNVTIAQGLAALVNGSGQYTAIYNNGGVGVNTFDVFSIPNTTNGNPYTNTITLKTISGTLSGSNISAGSASTAAGVATGSFQILAGANDVQGVLTASIVPNNNDTVTIGATTYTFKTALTPAANEVLIGGSAANAIANLSMAIGASGTLNTNYGAVTANASATATAPTAGNSITVNSIISGSVAVSESTSGARLVWSGLSGGNLSAATLNYVSSIKVGTTELLTANVPFAKDLTTTIANVVSNIFANRGVSGITAASSGNTINLSTTSGTASFNGDAITVTAHGMFFCDNCVFTITGTSFTCDYIRVSDGTSNNTGTGVISSSFTFPTSTEGLPFFAQRICTNINAGSSGYKALSTSGTATIFLSKTTTSTSDSLFGVQVSLTGTAGGSGGTSNPLSVSISPSVPAMTNWGRGWPSKPTGIILSDGTSQWSVSGPITVTPSGGTPPYTYTYTIVSPLTFRSLHPNQNIGVGTTTNPWPYKFSASSLFVIDSGWSPSPSIGQPSPLLANSTSSTVAIFSPTMVSATGLADTGSGVGLRNINSTDTFPGSPPLGQYSTDIVINILMSVQVTDSVGSTGIAGPVNYTLYGWVGP